jgi:anti-sigma regulatory factor (Ser/Thr protein kinase)
VRSSGGTVTADVTENESSRRYLSRMGFGETLDIDLGITQVEHAPEGRFDPINMIVDQAGLNDFIVRIVPLLHATPDKAGPIKFVITELVRNVLEHAASPVGAVVCAQYYAQIGRLSLGVADLGIGVRGSISQFHHAPDDLAAIQMALRPGVTGATPVLGGNEQNAGAGLFLTKSIARASRNFFVIYSGSAMFKLLTTADTAQMVLHSNPEADRATRESGLPAWPGTAVGIDIKVPEQAQFSRLLGEIRAVYRLDVRDRRKAKYRRPRLE